MRSVVAELSQRFPHASALAMIRLAGSATADAGEHGSHHEIETALVLTVWSGLRRFEEATTDLSARGMNRAMDRLRKRTSAGYQATRPALPMAGPQDMVTPPVVDPQQAKPNTWIDRVRELYERGRRVGGSRVVYRGAYVLADDRTLIYAGERRDLLQRLLCTRAGVVLVAQRGARQGAIPVAESADRSGLLGLEATDIPLAELEAAAERVLALVTPQAPPTGETELVLGPTIAARIAYHGVASALEAGRWTSGQARAAAYLGQAVGSPLVTLTDDPTRPGAYGSYFFDDEGHPASSTLLIDRGTLVAPLTDATSAALLDVPRTGHGRRLTPLHPVAPRPSNVVLASGAASQGELIGAVKRGLYLDGGLMASMDARSWRFSARAGRAYEIVDGKLTGVLHGVVDIRGDVPALLGSVQGVSSESQTMAASTDLAATATAPSLLARAEVCS